MSKEKNQSNVKYDPERINQPKRVLKRIAVGGLTTVGLIMAINWLTKEISYNLENNKIATYMDISEDLENKTIVINGEEFNVGKEIHDYAIASQILNEAKHNGNEDKIEERENLVQDEAQDIQNIGIQVTKDTAIKKSGFEGGANTHTELYTHTDKSDSSQTTSLISVQTGESYYANGTGLRKFGPEVSGNFTIDSVNGNTEGIINGLTSALENGEGIEVGRTR